MQILVDGKDTDGIEGRQHVVEHRALLIVLGRETVAEECLCE